MKILVLLVFFISQISFAQKAKVPTAKYITGGVLGSTIGFGIGHAVQDRYSDKGWIFTAGQAGSLALLVGGLQQIKNCRDDETLNSEKDKCTNAAATVGLLGLVGFHVWEIVDVWTGAEPVDDGPKAMIIPDVKNPGIGVAWKF